MSSNPSSRTRWRSSSTALVLFLVTTCAVGSLLAQDSTAVKPDEARLRAAYTDAESAFRTLGENTRERAEATQKAAHLASENAWLAFDSGKPAEAATWFAKSAELKRDGSAHAHAYWERVLQEEARANEAKMAQRIAEFRALLAAAKDDAEKQSAHTAIASLERIRYTVRSGALSMLDTIAREENDSAGRIRYAELELEFRSRELDFLKESASPAKEIQQKQVQIAATLERRGDAQAEAAMFDAAEKSFQEALAIRRALPEELPERRQQQTLTALGLMYLQRVGDLAKAREYFLQALAATESGAELRKAGRAADPASPEMIAHLPPEQAAAHQASLEQRRQVMFATDVLAHATILNNLGSIAQEMGDFRQAAGYHERAIALADTLPQGGDFSLFDIARLSIRARSTSERAGLFATMGELDRAQKELEAAISLTRSLGKDEYTARSLQQAAWLAHERGDLDAAKRYTEQARQIFVAAHQLRDVVAATGSLAIFARDAGQLEEAARLIEEALPLARKTGNIAAVASTARAAASIRLRQGQLDPARALLREASEVDASTHSPGDRLSTLSLSGQLAEAEGKDEDALASYKQAIQLLETIRATATSEAAFAELKQNFKAYERIVRLLIRMNRLDEAFDYLNRAKSKKLQESLRLANARSGDRAMQELLDRAGALEKKLQTVESQVQREQALPEAERDKARLENLKLVAASTQGEFRRVVEQIKASNPGWEKFMTVNPKALKETQRSIPPGVVFLQYAPLGEQLYIFLVTHDRLKIYTPPVKPQDLWKKVRTVRRQIATGESGAPLTRNLSALYEMLIQPIEAELAGAKTLAFIPNQLLFYLPMQALVRKTAEGGTRYLIEEKEIVYLTAADVMKVVQPVDEGKARGGMIAVGNPAGAGLPSSEVEVNTIANVFPATDVISGERATKEAITAREAFDTRVVHFATHGILNSAAPDQSYIQLAAKEGNGGDRLTVGEVWDLPMKKVDLVTLSACESALGDKDPDGGEITTLAEAFASAGAATVVASLWSVEDESTKDLMVHFYRELAAGKTKAAALQSAQLAVMKDPRFSRPLYWAPFVLMGDWR